MKEYKWIKEGVSEPLFDVGDDECVERVDGDLHPLCAHVVEQELHVAQLARVRARPHYVRKRLLFTPMSDNFIIN